MSAITAKASRKMKKYAVLTREPRCFLGSFDFSWEQRKFSELVQIERGGSPRPIDDFITDAPNGLNWVKIGDAPTQGNYITKTAEKIRPEGLSKTREVHPGDLILSNSMSFGKPYIMGIDGCIHDGWLLIRNTYGVFDLTFLCHLLGTPQMLSQYRSLAAGSTVNNLNKELVENTVVTIPSITEQRVLGDYLEQLDNLITLHQRKCALLFSPFQALISMMFTTSTFSWEQRKLGDIGETYTGLSGKTKADFGHGQARFVTYMNVFSNPISNPEMTEPIEIDPKQNEVEVGDVLFTTSSETPEEVGMSSVLLEKRGKTYLNSFCFGFRPSEKIDSYYLAYMLRSESAREKIILLAQGISRYNISKNKVMEIAVSLPSLDEQKLIGQYFRQLDHLITLHQRKCISFTGRAGRLISTVNKKRITSSWEQRKLGDIADIVGGGTPSTGNQSYWDGDIDWYAPAEIADQIYANSSQKKITGLGYENSSAKMLPPGTVLFTSRAGIGKTAILTRKGCTNQGFQSIVPHRGELDSYFIFSRTEELKRYGEFVGAGSTFVEVSGKQMAVMELMMPPTMREQQTIGGFFQQLDHIITLHQRKPFLMKWRNSDANRNQTNRLVL